MTDLSRGRDELAFVENVRVMASPGAEISSCRRAWGSLAISISPSTTEIARSL